MARCANPEPPRHFVYRTDGSDADAWAPRDGSHLAKGPCMTSELQRAMARYEEARGRYRLAVLASLRGAAGGDVIRTAIRECQAAGEDVRRLTAPPCPARTRADRRRARRSLVP